MHYIFSILVALYGTLTVASTISQRAAAPLPPSPVEGTSNGVPTPSPIQPGIVNNCKRFYLRKDGEFCQAISNANGISLNDFYKYNPSVGSDCSTLLPNVNVCVAVLPTPTQGANGITTPLPTQPGMVNYCKKFYYRSSGEFCGDIASKSGIALSDFYRLNPGVGSDCSALQPEVYTCTGE